MLQSKAGYIDARPHIRQLEEVLLQRTAGPYIWVIFDRDEASSRSRHVGCAPESGSKISVLASASTGRSGLMASPGA
jgi:hypothetical protein